MNGRPKLDNETDLMLRAYILGLADKCIAENNFDGVEARLGIFLADCYCEFPDAVQCDDSTPPQPAQRCTLKRGHEGVHFVEDVAPLPSPDLARDATKKIIEYITSSDNAEPDDSTGSPSEYIERIIT